MTVNTGQGSRFQIRYPLTRTGLRDARRPLWVRLPFILAWLGLLLYLLISANLLVANGIPYDIPSGSFLFKIHPGTYLIALGFVLLLVQDNPREHWPPVFRRAAPALILAAVVVMVLIYTVARFGPSGTAFFIDTLLAPALLAAILLQAPVDAQRLVFRLVLALLVLNAIIGIAEALTQSHLVPYLIGDQPMIEDYFRATALGGFPLKNGLRTGMLLIACLILPLTVRLFLVPLLLVALLAFGSRTALTFSLLLFGALGVYHFARDLAGRKLDARLAFGLIVVTLVMVAGIAVLAETSGIGQRIFEKFYWDSSAHSRILVFKVFDYVTLQDWLWGMGPAKIEALLDRLKGSTILTDLENFWVLLLLEVGLAWFIPLSLALLGMIISLSRRAPPVLRWAAALFLILASANNSLAVKSQDLAILVAILIGGAAEAAMLRTPRP